MTLKAIILFSIAFFLFSCNNQLQESEVNTDSAKQSSLHCYRYVNKNDTVILKTVDANGFITGTLVYNFYEKDKNKGTIQGKMKGELLIADYSFTSEGLNSVRQVAFKKEGNTLIEGYGETEDVNGKARFTNIDSLNFSHSIVLTEMDCEE